MVIQLIRKEKAKCNSKSNKLLALSTSQYFVENSLLTVLMELLVRHGRRFKSYNFFLHTRIDRGNLMSRHSIFRFLIEILRGVAELNAALKIEQNAKKVNSVELTIFAICLNIDTMKYKNVMY